MSLTKSAEACAKVGRRSTDVHLMRMPVPSRAEGAPPEPASMPNALTAPECRSSSCGGSGAGGGIGYNRNLLS
jgi:hypothetical protein